MDKKIIWMIHLGRIRWIEESWLNKIIEDAKYDLLQLQEAWIKSACIINESDIPYSVTISEKEKVFFLKAAQELKKESKIQLGVCVLYNDWKATLDIAKAIEADFVRIDTFVDLVESDAGIIYPEAQRIKEYQRRIWAENIMLLTDIHPKYKKMLEAKSLSTSANEAFNEWSNGIILTWTCSWDPVKPEDLKKLKWEIWNWPIYLWSGVSKENIKEYRDYIDGAFIGTSLKTDWKINKQKVVDLIMNFPES